MIEEKYKRILKIVENLPQGMPWKQISDWLFKSVSGFRFLHLIQAYLRKALSFKQIFVHNSGVEITGGDQQFKCTPQQPAYIERKLPLNITSPGRPEGFSQVLDNS